MTLKNSENNGTEEIGLITPTPGPQMMTRFTYAYMHYLTSTINVCHISYTMEMETCFTFLALCEGIHLSPVDSLHPHKDQWRTALMFSLIYVWTNGWANNWDAGDLRRHRTHYDVRVLILCIYSRNIKVSNSISIQLHIWSNKNRDVCNKHTYHVLRSL